MKKSEPMTPRKKRGLILFFLGIFITLILSGIGENVLVNPAESTKHFFSLFATSGIILSIYAVGKMLTKEPMTLNLDDDNLPSNYIKGVIIGAVLLVLFVIISNFLGGINYEGFGNLSAIGVILYIVGFIIQGFSEEIMVRGFLQEAISGISKTLSILLPSILFSLLHLGNDNFSFIAMFNTMLIGILFGLMTSETGSLWMASGAHSIWNFLLGPFFGLIVSGRPMENSVLNFSQVENNEFLNGGSYGPEASYLVMIIIIIAIIPFLISFIKNNKA